MDGESLGKYGVEKKQKTKDSKSEMIETKREKKRLKKEK